MADPQTQASECVNDLGAAIGQTACILFTSRGIRVDPGGAPPSVGAPTGNDAVYLSFQAMQATNKTAKHC